MAQQALECGPDGCLMPTWSAPPTPAQRELASGGGDGGGGARPRFRQVLGAYGSSGAMLGRWARGKSGALVGRVVPTSLKKAAVRVAARVAESRD